MEPLYDIKNYSQDNLLLRCYHFLEESALESILEVMKDNESEQSKQSICLKYGYKTHFKTTYIYQVSWNSLILTKRLLP